MTISSLIGVSMVMCDARCDVFDNEVSDGDQKRKEVGWVFWWVFRNVGEGKQGNRETQRDRMFGNETRMMCNPGGRMDDMR